MTLHISMNIPGSDLSNSPIDEAVTFLASYVAVEKRHGRLPVEPTLDITFMLSGKHERPDFEGMRMGGYTRDNKTLYFQTAVPSHITRSENAMQYVALVMQDMIDNADIFFADAGVSFAASHWRTVLESFTNPDQNEIKH